MAKASRNDRRLKRHARVRKDVLELPRSQDCAYLDRTAIFQLRSSMTLTEQLLYPHRLSIRNLRQVLQTVEIKTQLSR